MGLEAGMKIYTFYKKEEALDTVIPIAEGFSWMAFIFSIFWPIYHRLWSMTIAYLIYYFVVGTLHTWKWIGEFEVLLLHFVFLFLMGATAYDWQRWSLKQQGYILFDIVSGTTKEEALRRFFDLHTLQKPAKMKPL